jgi:hypothetical protein
LLDLDRRDCLLELQCGQELRPLSGRNDHYHRAHAIGGYKVTPNRPYTALPRRGRLAFS